MTDMTTGKPLRVFRDGRSGPYLIVPNEQVDTVRRVLDRARVHYWVDNTAISMSGGPAMAVVNFGKSANPDEIQVELDHVA